jgi:hypothetical protein
VLSARRAKLRRSCPPCGRRQAGIDAKPIHAFRGLTLDTQRLAGAPRLDDSTAAKHWGTTVLSRVGFGSARLNEYFGVWAIDSRLARVVNLPRTPSATATGKPSLDVTSPRNGRLRRGSAKGKGQSQSALSMSGVTTLSSHAGAPHHHARTRGPAIGSAAGISVAAADYHRAVGIGGVVRGEADRAQGDWQRVARRRRRGARLMWTNLTAGTEPITSRSG